MTDEEWKSSWKSHVMISRCQLAEVLSRATGLDQRQLAEVIETYDEIVMRYVKPAHPESFGDVPPPQET